MPSLADSRLFTGKSWQDKIGELKDNMRENGYDATVLTALDEISWLFNLKGGSDIPHSPMFYSYAVLTLNEGIKLYIYPEKHTDSVKQHLNSYDCRDGGDDCVELRGGCFQTGKAVTVAISDYFFC